MADWNCGTGVPGAEDVASIQCLVPIFENVVRSVIALGGVALFIMLLVGGFNFLFSGGDQKKLEAARGTITQAIVGLVIMSIAYLIINFIATFTGIDALRSFQIKY